MGHGRSLRRAAGAHLSHARAFGAVLDRAGAATAGHPEAALHWAGVYQRARLATLRNHPVARLSACLPERRHLVRGLVLLGVPRDARVWRIERAGGGGRVDLVLPLSRAVSRAVWGAARTRSAQPQPWTTQRAAARAISLGRRGAGAGARHRISLGPAGNGASG